LQLKADGYKLELTLPKYLFRYSNSFEASFLNIWRVWWFDGAT